MPELHHRSTNPRAVRDALVALNEYTTDRYFKLELWPTEFRLGANATLTTAGGGNYDAIQLPDAVTGSCSATLAVPIYWINGSIDFRLLYTGSASSTATFDLTLAAKAVAVNGALGTPTTIINNVASRPGPATGDDLLSVTIPSTANVESTHRLLSVSVSRDGAADANAGNFLLLGIEVFYRNVNKQ